MTLVKYTRRRPVLSLYDDMNSLFNQLWLRPFSTAPVVNRDWSPAFDIRETKDQFVFEAALPGLNKKDIDVTLHDGVLTIGGERDERQVNEDETIHTTELRTGKFSRSFTLPTEVDEQDIAAKYANGILSISLNKLAPVEAEKTKIVVK